MVLREVLAEGVEALEDPGLGFVTITAVRAASDLSQASVYVSVLGSEQAARARRERSSAPTGCCSRASPASST